MIWRVFGCMVLAASLAGSIAIVNRYNPDFYIQIYQQSPGAPFVLGIEALLLLVCWAVAAGAWWLIVPRRRVSFRVYSGWFIILSGTWLIVLSIYGYIIGCSASMYCHLGGWPAVFCVILVGIVGLSLFLVWYHLIHPKKREDGVSTTIQPTDEPSQE